MNISSNNLRGFSQYSLLNKLFSQKNGNKTSTSNQMGAAISGGVKHKHSNLYYDENGIPWMSKEQEDRCITGRSDWKKIVSVSDEVKAELDASLGYEKNQKGAASTSNKRNGHSPKTLKSRYGEFQIDVPRDREGEFEPKLIPKYQRDISGIEEQVVSLYARGMSTRDIHDQIQELYGMELSAEMVSKITDRILPEIKEWQSPECLLYK